MSPRNLLRRLIGAGVTLFVVTLITFVALESSPGDAASGMVGDKDPSAEQLQELRAQLRLDQPLPVRYGAFLADLVLHGDLGHSLISNKPVSEMLVDRVPYTLLLALAAAVLAVSLGALVGIGAAVKSGTPLESALMGGAAFGLAVPTFWVALLLMLLFSVRLRWLPVVGAASPAHLILPAVTLALPAAAGIARLMRSSLLEVLRSDYVRTAHSKGLRPRQVLARHVVRNSLIPVVTLLGLHLGYLLSGAFVVETIFGWPGLGRMTVQAIFDRDYPVVVGTTLMVALVYVLINLAVDLAHGWLDPQVAHEVL